jgi:transposase-like protein
MARPGRPERNRAARSFRQLRRFHHVINSNKVFGTHTAAELAFDAFIESYTPKYEKAADCLSKDRDTLLAFYDFPAEHWKHLRTTNPIESTFATVRHRTIRSKGCLSNRTALAMVFKLLEACRPTSCRISRVLEYLPLGIPPWCNQPAPQRRSGRSAPF